MRQADAEFARIVWDFTERQAQAIIELQLQRLTGMEQQKILDELAEIQRLIGEYLEILGSEKRVRQVIVDELKEVQKDFGDERRTEIIEDTGEIKLEDLVQMEDVAITVTRGGYLKRTAVDTYRRQSRGGKGRIGMGTRSEDVVEYLIVASTHAYLLVFTNKGRVYWLKNYEIPDAGTTGKGKHISGLVNLQPDETVTAFLPVKDFVDGQYIAMVTKRGVIKRCALTEFDNPMSRGIIAVGLDEGDELLSAKLTQGECYIFLASHEGMAIRFKEDDVRAMGRPARGVRGMELAEGDYLVSTEVVTEDDLILTISENGYGKRTKLTEYRLTGRGRKGVINMKTTKKVGKVVASLAVQEDSDLMIITSNGKMIRLEAGEIRQAGRSTQGVRLVRMEEGDQVAAATVIPESDENGNGNGSTGRAISRSSNVSASRRFAIYAWAVLAFNIGVVLWGAYVRATGAGAGCGNHWPLCNGEVVPRPQSVAMLVEFTHRITSGIALLAIVGSGCVGLPCFAARPAGANRRRALGILYPHRSSGRRCARSVSARGAGPVDCASVVDLAASHKYVPAVAVLALTAWWATTDESSRQLRLSWPLTAAICGLILLGISGAIAALGDTLFPASSLTAGMAQDVSSSAHLFVRLRMFHPFIAVAAVAILLFAVVRTVKARNDAATHGFGVAVGALAFVQLMLGAINVAMLAPVPMQIVHLLFADLLWIALVLFAARAATTPVGAAAAGR